jgi:hypothetical protein
MKAGIFVVLILLLVLLAAFAVKHSQSPGTDSESSPINVEPPAEEHTYATWDTIEVDKCIAAWLIVHFIDKDAKFVLYPQGTEIKEGIVFDNPGAAWSRKHRMCTSDCILQSIDVNDVVVEKIVEIAHQTELNYWQLDQFPLARKCFDEIQRIFEGTTNRLECLEKAIEYFDVLYNQLRQQSGSNHKH